MVDLWWTCGELEVNFNKIFVRLVAIFVAGFVVNFNQFVAIFAAIFIADLNQLVAIFVAIL